jgi:hypothetical protein
MFKLQSQTCSSFQREQIQGVMLWLLDACVLFILKCIFDMYIQKIIDMYIQKISKIFNS